MARTNGKVAHGFKTSVGLPAKTREPMIALLNQNLADTSDLASQLKQAHWNVKGPEFYQLHKMFDALVEDVIEWADMLAERATALGGYATGTVRMAASSSRLPEFPVEATDGMEHVRALVDRYGIYCSNTRDAIDTAEKAGDMGTSDLFTELSRCADKQLYFLEAHLQG